MNRTVALLALIYTAWMPTVLTQIINTATGRLVADEDEITSTAAESSCGQKK